MKDILKFFAAVAAAVFISGFVFYLNASAFNGPTQSPPNGNGALGINTMLNLGLGTSTPSNASKLLIVGSTTDSSAYTLKILDSAQNQLFTIRNDGVVTVSTSTVISGGSWGGTISSGNVSAGQFGSNTGGGNFSFPAGITATSGTISLASTTITGNATATTLTTTGAATLGSLSVGGTASVTGVTNLATTTTAGKLSVGTTTAPAAGVNALFAGTATSTTIVVGATSPYSPGCVGYVVSSTLVVWESYEASSSIQVHTATSSSATSPKCYYQNSN